MPPYLAQAATNLDGAPMQVFAAIGKGTATHRAQYYKDFALTFYR